MASFNVFIYLSMEGERWVNQHIENSICFLHLLLESSPKGSVKKSRENNEFDTISLLTIGKPPFSVESKCLSVWCPSSKPLYLYLSVFLSVSVSLYSIYLSAMLSVCYHAYHPSEFRDFKTALKAHLHYPWLLSFSAFF